MKLFDQFGRPIDTSALLEEKAAGRLTSIRNVWHEGVATGLTPERLAAILREAAQGESRAYLTLAEEMEERDPHYRSVLSTRKLSVSGLDANVVAASEDKADVALADEIRAVLASPIAGDLFDDLLDGLGKGYSVVEINWARSAKRWEPSAFVWRDPRFFIFDRDTGTELRLLDEKDPVFGLPLTPYKFIRHVPRLKTGIPIRGGLARLVSTAWMCKSFGLRDWMAFADVFGMPLRVGRYGPSATDKDIRTLINAVANLGSDAAAVIPESMKIDFQEAGNGAGGPQLFQALAEWLDRQVSKAVLGQTMTTDDGSSLAQAKVHNEVRADLQRADAKQLERTINRDFVKAYIDLNHGPQLRYPQVQLPIAEEEDLEKYSKAVTPFIDRGLRVPAAAIREKLRLPEPLADEEVLVPPSSRGTAQSAATNRVAMNRSSTVDDLEEIRDSALGDWMPMMDPVLQPLRELAERSSSAEEFAAGLDDLLSRMEPDEVTRRLAIAMFEAHALGNVED